MSICIPTPLREMGGTQEFMRQMSEGSGLDESHECRNNSPMEMISGESDRHRIVVSNQTYQLSEGSRLWLHPHHHCWKPRIGNTFFEYDKVVYRSEIFWKRWLRKPGPAQC